MTAAVESTTPSAVIDRVSLVLDAFDGPGRLTLAQVVRRTGLPRSSAHRMLERLVAYAHQRKENGAEGWVIQHIRAEEQARDLIETMRAQVFGSDPVFTSEVGPVLAAHTGPGLLGFGSVPRDLVE